MFEALIQQLEALSETIPLPWFVALGSFIEELLAPIPSPLVMGTVGSILQGQQFSWWYVIGLCLLGAATKTAASYLLYLLSDKAEDIFTSKFGRWLELSPNQVEGFGERLRKHNQDWISLLVMRSLPFFPSGPVSVLAGIIKIDLRVFLLTTLVGTTIRNFLYLLGGLVGSYYLDQLGLTSAQLESFGYVVLASVIFYYLYQQGFVQKLVNKFKK